MDPTDSRRAPGLRRARSALLPSGRAGAHRSRGRTARPGTTSRPGGRPRSATSSPAVGAPTGPCRHRLGCRRTSALRARRNSSAVERSAPDQPVGPLDQRVALTRFQLAQRPASHIDMRARHGAVGQRLTQLGKQTGWSGLASSCVQRPSESVRDASAKTFSGYDDTCSTWAATATSRPSSQARSRAEDATTSANTRRSRQAGCSPPTASTSSCTSANSIRTTVRRGCGRDGYCRQNSLPSVSCMT